MFIKTQGFKKLIQEAYKGPGLKVGRDELGIYIAGSYWVMQIKEGGIPKKELAAVIELTGELPDKGSGFNATKTGNQYELQNNPIYRVLENAEECKEKLEVTKLIVETRGKKGRILQSGLTGEITVVNEQFIDMIDASYMDYENGEAYLSGPMVGKHYGVFWSSNSMAMHVLPRNDEAATGLIKRLEGFRIEGEYDVPEETI